jgi:hypothetical protein
MLTQTHRLVRGRGAVPSLGRGLRRARQRPVRASDRLGGAGFIHDDCGKGDGPLGQGGRWLL